MIPYNIWNNKCLSNFCLRWLFLFKKEILQNQTKKIFKIKKKYLSQMLSLVTQPINRATLRSTLTVPYLLIFTVFNWKKKHKKSHRDQNFICIFYCNNIRNHWLSTSLNALHREKDPIFYFNVSDWAISLKKEFNIWFSTKVFASVLLMYICMYNVHFSNSFFK